MTIRHVHLDTEFLRADLTRTGTVSIALHDEDGSDYYAVNAGMNATAVYADDWMRENVWPYIPHDQANPDRLDTTAPEVKPFETIRDEIAAYFAHTSADETRLYAWKGGQDIVRLHSFWDHDWAVMPPQIPCWMQDLRALADLRGNPPLPRQESGKHHPLDDARHNHAIRQRLARDLPDTQFRARLAGARPATDSLLLALAEASRDLRTHDHPTGIEDLYCTNLAAWAGERVAPVLRRLLDAEAERNLAENEVIALRERLDAHNDLY